MNPLQLFGRAVAYGTWSEPVDGKRFRITRGSYVPDEPTVAHWSHDKKTLIGTTENQSLRFSETDLGLHFELDLPRTSEARKVYRLVRDDYVTGVSFGMQVIDARKVGSSNGVDDYEVTRFKLTEISPTAKPSFKGTSVSTSNTIREGRDQIVRDAQLALTSDLRRRTAQRQLQQAQLGLRRR